MNGNRLLQVEDVAELLGVSTVAFYGMRKRGYSPRAIRVGKRLRFDPDDVRQWLDEHREPPRRGRPPKQEVPA